jgi:competence protein ComEA
MSLKHFMSTFAAMLLLAPLVVRAEPVNINTADATALAKALNGIGPAKAKAIVSYREKNGPFKSADQLAMVEGISQKLIDRNRADIRLGAEKAGAEKAGAEKSAPDKQAAAPKPAARPAS